MEPTESAASSGPYKCKNCDRSFQSAQALGGHQNAHRVEIEIEKRNKLAKDAVGQPEPGNSQPQQCPTGLCVSCAMEVAPLRLCIDGLDANDLLSDSELEDVLKPKKKRKLEAMIISTPVLERVGILSDVPDIPPIFEDGKVVDAAEVDPSTINGDEVDLELRL